MIPPPGPFAQMTSKGPSTGGGITWRAGWYRSAVAIGRPIEVSAGAIWASESLPITVTIGRDSSRPPTADGGVPERRRNYLSRLILDVGAHFYTDFECESTARIRRGAESVMRGTHEPPSAC